MGSYLLDVGSFANVVTRALLIAWHRFIRVVSPAKYNTLMREREDFQVYITKIGKNDGSK